MFNCCQCCPICLGVALAVLLKHAKKVPPLSEDSLISNSCIQRKDNSLEYSLLLVLVQYVDITGNAFKVQITRY